jgi:ribonucleotide reductase beta subunit family protein with ferritin-like domain
MSVVEQSSTKAISYEHPYRRWENGNWSAYDLDLGGDRRGWEALSEIQRKSVLWIYSMFFYGEDSVAGNLSPTSTRRQRRSRSASSPPSRWTRPATPSSSTAS